MGDGEVGLAERAVALLQGGLQRAVLHLADQIERARAELRSITLRVRKRGRDHDADASQNRQSLRQTHIKISSMIVVRQGGGAVHSIIGI